MTILRSGTSTKYSENWAHAFGRSGGSGVQKKKKTKCKSRKKKTAAKKKSKKKTAAKKKTKVKVTKKKSAKKKTPAKKRKASKTARKKVVKKKTLKKKRQKNSKIIMFSSHQKSDLPPSIVIIVRSCKEIIRYPLRIYFRLMS